VGEQNFQSSFIKNVVIALATVFLGFIFLIFSYVLDHFLHFAVILFVKSLFNHDLATEFFWFPQAMHVLYIFLITYISVLVLGSGFPTMYKASYAMVPFALVYITFYIFYFPWPDFVYFVSLLFYISVFYFFYKVRVHWLYYFSFTLVSLGLYIASISNLSF
jgi:hypothetical protein